MSMSRKRPAAVVSPSDIGAAAKKKKLHVSEVAIEKCRGIIATLGESPVPKSVSNMLSSAIGASFDVPVTERHQYHTIVIEMVSEILGDTERALQLAIDNSAASLSQIQEKRDSLQSSRGDAEQKHSALRQTVADRKVAAESQLGVLAGAKAKLADAKRLQKEGDDALLRVAATKNDLENAFQHAYQRLKVKAAGGHEGDADLKLLEKIGHDVGFDKSLVCSFLCVLKRAPEERTQFDSMVLQQLEVELQNSTSALNKSLAEGEDQTAARAQVVASASEAADAAAKEHDLLAEALLSAKEADQRGFTDLQAAEANLANALRDCEAANQVVVKAQQRLKFFQLGALDSFVKLKESGVLGK